MLEKSMPKRTKIYGMPNLFWELYIGHQQGVHVVPHGLRVGKQLWHHPDVNHNVLIWITNYCAVVNLKCIWYHSYITVRYEDLVSDLVGKMQELYSFIGIPLGQREKRLIMMHSKEPSSSNWRGKEEYYSTYRLVIICTFTLRELLWFLQQNLTST